MIQDNIYNYLKTFYPEELPSYTKRKIPQEYIVDEFSDTSEDEYINSIQKKDKIFCSYIEQYIDQIVTQQEFPLFNKIEIETYNKCNNTCSFCPVSQGNDRRTPHLMERALFNNIIDQLSQLNYNGVICLYSNNEPLLDKRIPEFLQLTRKKLPNAFILFYTNGLNLTQELLKTLLYNTDFLYINCYMIEKVLPERIKRVQEYLISEHVPQNRVEIHLRNKTEHLSTRAGNAPNRIHPACLISKCILPFSQMVIRPDGKVSLCCNDAYGEYTLGDLNKEPLLQVWYGSSFQSLREQMSHGRLGHLACRKCDMLYMPLAYEKHELRGMQE